MMKKITIIINLIYFLIALLFYLDLFTSFDIKDEQIKSFIYYSVFLLIPFILLYNFKRLQSFSLKVVSFIIPIISIILILTLSPIKIIFLSSSWKTQTIMYKHKYLSFKKIELQMQDIGALGYNKRIVEVLYLTKYFMVTRPVSENIKNKVEWLAVNKEINELGIK